MIAAVLAAGLDGLTRELELPPSADGWSYENESAAVLPTTLAAALDALDADSVLRGALGAPLAGVFSVLKRDEVARYERATDDPSTRDVTRWELDEYLEDY